MNYFTTGYFEWLVDKTTLFDQTNSFMLFILYNEQSNPLIWIWVNWILLSGYHMAILTSLTYKIWI